MFASLPMYDRPENRAAHDALWDGVRGALGFGPEALDRETDHVEGWGRDDLLLGQICNLPYRAQFRDNVTRIACSDYGLTDTPAGYYHSVFVVRAEDAPRGLAPATLGRFAYNDALSHSGWGGPLARVTEQGLQFHTTLHTGAHIDSMKAVVDGRADLAAIDAVTWRMLQSWEPRSAELRVIGRTGLSPGMTFITAKTIDPAPIKAALNTAIAELSPEHAQTLGVRGIVELADSAYDLPIPKAP
ncbi:ABC transporter, phosphonate, substrate-binding protein [Octadecabacter temperatus]|uniref:ABC transporter, phosphonate, periplasmic substrate-binding protein n=1 Tax=Octadecabacter temperatus TaxID=1458307 RepID=A0A0K0Y3V9_9RHOB|nr:PhnD/SsuA/transferrin family substrate-binding protein [Octadecabacter temperatus]AKS45581.1 ABC transporter, phosphonate, periplasmic substrate-binding protein [Octadecabacter temperatus]SIN96197.1 ABC transporter, phosphonate, substrate-binding protein [Octadecabacter temperatus]